jgi:3-hydroxyisobutyrate dehydrogenase
VSVRVGLLGVGRMGAGVGATLARAGHDVLAFDVREERRAAAPLRWAASAAQLAEEADVLFSSLPGSPELAVAMPPVLGAMRPHSVWVDLTSASPAVAAPLAAAAAQRGLAWLDAPVGGGPAEAAEGALRLYVGGDVATLERVRPLLEALGAVEHMGPAGTGYMTKLLVNLLWFGQALAGGEALLLGARAGIAPESLLAALGRSAAASEFLARDAPRVLDGDYLPDFGLDRCCEELDALVAIAGELRLPFELSAEVARGYARALERLGARAGELLAVALLEERAGTRLRRG